MGDTTAALDSVRAKRTGSVLKLNQVAILTGYSVAALYKMIDAGLPVDHGGGSPGRPVYINVARLIDWLLQRERERVMQELSGVSIERLQAAGVQVMQVDEWAGVRGEAVGWMETVGNGKTGAHQSEEKNEKCGVNGDGEDGVNRSAAKDDNNDAGGDGHAGENMGTGGERHGVDGNRESGGNRITDTAEKNGATAPGGDGNAAGGSAGMLDWKLRSGLATARLKELQVQREMGMLVPIEAVELAFSNLVSIARARLMAMESRLSPLCAAAGNDIMEQRKIIGTSVHDVLEELASEKPETLIERMSLVKNETA